MAQGTHRRIVSFHGVALRGKANWHAEHLKANRRRRWPRGAGRSVEPLCRESHSIPYNRSFPNHAAARPQRPPAFEAVLADCPRTP
ncbi:hypothetical protein EGY19_05865 [Burkholderia multivorans]|nr:hypothetical protein EGY19_05865 [Burkholderia multivorans]PRF46627.1 hypothetical protein C6Q04_21220 [Burkholderia multivorans]PRF51407.1 hypothetical protein C6Q28_29735 [Burkholderia multivorans]PRG47891.1 hypothetical protein C6T63_27085 [Burkholderia multivorans]